MDNCIPYDFSKYILQQKQFDIISQPNLTYQKSNKIVLSCLQDNEEKLSHLKYKLIEKFNLIHYVYSILYAKIYNRINHFGIKRKNDFDFQFELWRKEKQRKNIGKEPLNYVNRKIQDEE